jgi:hypothetical protein
MVVIPGGDGTPIPDAPDTVDAGTWDRLWTIGRSWLSNDAHFDMMVMLCESLADRERFRKAARRKAAVVRGSMGQDRISPAWAQVDAIDAKVARLFEQLGFSPAKQKVRVAGTARKSKLDQLRAAAR